MDVCYTHLAWCALVIGHFFNSLCSNELIISSNNYLGCLDIFSYHFVSCMRFSRYILFWLFYQSSEIKISFHLWSLVNPVLFFCRFGSHLLSHTVSSAVPSASQVLTIVFGMGTGVSPGRIATEKLVLSEVLHELRTKLCSSFLARSFRALVRRTSSFQNTHN